MLMVVLVIKPSSEAAHGIPAAAAAAAGVAAKLARLAVLRTRPSISPAAATIHA